MNTASRTRLAVILIACTISSMAFMLWFPHRMLPAFSILATVVGGIDGWFWSKLRWVRSWLPALIAALGPVAIVATIEAFVKPSAFNVATTLALACVMVASFALAFVAIVLASSALVRIVRRPTMGKCDKGCLSK